MKPLAVLMQRTILIAVILSCASCGSSGLKLHPVRGKVLYEGEPAQGATVVLHPLGERSAQVKPAGSVEADGTFSLHTYPHGTGAPSGEYLVLVTWYPPNARELDDPTNKLPARYADHSTTPLPKVTIAEGPTELEPFVLTAR